MTEWTRPEYTPEEVDAAGDVLSSTKNLIMAHEWENALAVTGNWRSSHAYPLLAFRMTLTGRAQRVDPKWTIVAQRLKRMSSIEAKLTRLRRLKLSEVQDVGGCRAVVLNNNRVRQLVNIYEEGNAKSPHRGPRLLWTNDYILNPRKSGYRSYHLVYEYRAQSAKRSLRAFNGHRIEIQLRSYPQHAWATAVETVDAFTQQSLKSNLGKPEWSRFFALMGSAVALREKTPLVPGTPTDKAELKEELLAVERQVGAEQVLGQLQVATRHIETREVRHAVAFLLKLDASQGVLYATPYPKEFLPQASDDYLKVEREISGNPAIQAVLVSVDKVENLRKAYPNYYADLELFLRTLREALGRPPHGD